MLKITVKSVGKMFLSYVIVENVFKLSIQTKFYYEFVFFIAPTEYLWLVYEDDESVGTY